MLHIILLFCLNLLICNQALLLLWLDVQGSLSMFIQLPMRHSRSSKATLCAPTCPNKRAGILCTSKPHSTFATWLSCNLTYSIPRTKWFLWHQVFRKTCSFIKCIPNGG